MKKIVSKVLVSLFVLGGLVPMVAQAATTAKLVVITKVINDDGGMKTPSDFVIHVKALSFGTYEIPGSPVMGSSSGNTFNVNGGTYLIQPETPAYYTYSMTGYDCYGYAMVYNYTTTYCVVTFNDVPQPAAATLTVQKTTLPAGDTTSFPVSIAGFGTAAVVGTPVGVLTDSTDVVFGVNGGLYTVTEAPVAGWTQVSNGCVGISVLPGEHKVCEIVNRKDAYLTVIKQVVNDNGGTQTVSSFPLFLDGTTTTSGQMNLVMPGTHTVSETGMMEYAATFSGDCDSMGQVVILPGDNKICTITNNDIAPTITIITTVVNDDGRTRVASDFTHHVRQGGVDIAGSPVPGSVLGVTLTLPSAGNFRVVQNNAPVNYSSTYSGDCSQLDARRANFSIGIGQNLTCNVLENDLP